MATLLDGKSVAAALREELRAETAPLAEMLGRKPALATVQVGEDEASTVYASRIAKTLAGLGMECRTLQLPATATRDELQDLLRTIGDDPSTDGILPFLPLPDPHTFEDVVAALNPGKDVDGIHPENAGRLYLGQETFVPNTPAGGMEILRRYDLPLRGRRAVVVGRSNIVGKPMALLLLAEHATVTLCHSRTENLPAVCREADLLVAAVGRARMIRGDWVKPGAVIIDFGINPTETGIAGDVDFESVESVAAAITPVPGGTGPVTNLMLARNVLKAAKSRL
ncbi:MAG: bifunctional 5,10-methylenetetrahydrofolate dehydrogenase/5,10-methenyltetrahydrofolate cyclohydrolase [Armatimonadetes bacterium]|nr:bifunctional 5,10-methylenetetrahydrofolate dehydrogenase/5,10-methenyltetrahydrofolate cyclohydrolase [Armatimonadota bacterium]